MTSKGQVTVPKHLRERTGLRSGSEVGFRQRGDEIILSKASPHGRRAASEADEFAAYLDRVTGIVEIGMTTDAYMELLRGE
jgi:AbrB family looped-hinge helix DNA binding protein